MPDDRHGEERLRIGVVASPHTAIRLESLVPEVTWRLYRGLEGFSWWGDLDEVDVLMVEDSYLEAREASRRTRAPHGVLGELARMCREQVPLVFLVAPKRRMAELRLPAGAIVVRGPTVTRGLLLAALADLAKPIRVRRLRGLMDRVAAAFTGNLDS